MADVAPSKKGFRSRLGLKSSSSNTAPPRKSKKLSKKNRNAGGTENENISNGGATPSNQDGPFSLSRVSTNDSKGEDILDMYQYPDITASAPHAFRESSYSAVQMNTQAYPPAPPPHYEAYAQNFSRDRQYPGYAYDARTGSISSASSFQNLRDLDNQGHQYAPPGRAPPPVPGHRDQARTLHSDAYARYVQAQGRHYSPSLRPPPPNRPVSKLSKAHSMHKSLIDKDTGERKDLTDMLHAFTYDETTAHIEEVAERKSLDYDPTKPDGMATLASASPEVWDHIADYLSALDVANLAMSCRVVNMRLGQRPHDILNQPANRIDRLAFLIPMDSKLPDHLFCFPCARYHLRTHPGYETLKPANVLNPLFICPNSTNVLLPPPRIRITEGRTLPFTFIQLIKRAYAFGPEYGIEIPSLARRWNDAYSPWSHISTYHIHSNGHVMMRIKSQVHVEPGMTQAAKRILLYSRGDYTPYFSVCAHWKHGLLLDIPKCALNHIPVRQQSAMNSIKTQKASGIVTLCGECRPMRRCPECPSEYLFELKITEDKNVARNDITRFKQTLVVTRWSDLGAGLSPADPEWAAVAGTNGEGEKFDSFTEIGKRAVSGIFEAAFSDATPGQRILSMNPKNVRANEEGGKWY